MRFLFRLYFISLYLAFVYGSMHIRIDKCCRCGREGSSYAGIIQALGHLPTCSPPACRPCLPICLPIMRRKNSCSPPACRPLNPMTIVDRLKSLTLGLDLSPELFAISMVYFIQGALGVARLAVSFFLKDDLHLVRVMALGASTCCHAV